MSLSEPQPSFKSFHQALFEAFENIWDYCAVKRGHTYLAGFLIGVLAGLIGALHQFKLGFTFLDLAVRGVVGVVIVWLVAPR